MSLLNKGYRTIRLSDFGGGINVRDSNDSIDDKQSQVSDNFTSEGNKLITISGYSSYYTPASGVTRGQGIALYAGKILEIFNGNLYIYDTNSGTLHTKTGAVSSTTDTYQIISTKAFTGDVAIICINTNISSVEGIKGYEYKSSTGVFTTITWVGLNATGSFTVDQVRNFKCGMVYEGKILLGGNPLYPSSLYYSKTGRVDAPTNMYDFSGYSASSQNIGDGEAIVAIISNHNEVFVAKTNSIWRLNGVVDTGTVGATYEYKFKQETFTGAINWMCIIPVEQDIIYFDGINMRRLSYEININALNDDSISKEVQPVIDELPESQSANATMYFVYPHVKLFLRDKFSTNNSVGICYNIVDKSYSTQTGLNVVQGVGGFINNRRVAYFVSAQTSTIFQDNVGYTYNGGNVIYNHLSKRYTLGDGVDYKRISQIELFGKLTPGMVVNIDIYVNGLVVDTRQMSYDEVIMPTTGSSLIGNTPLGGSQDEVMNEARTYVMRLEYFHDGRDFMFGIRANGQGRFELHGLNLMYKPIKAYDIHY